MVVPEGIEPFRSIPPCYAIGLEDRCGDRNQYVLRVTIYPLSSYYTLSKLKSKLLFP